jgi:uncharacterized LabA/DUF88 family protein
MSFPPRFAILLDGGFVIKKLQSQLRRFPEPSDIDAICVSIKQQSELLPLQLLRIYFYDAPPAQGVVRNPLDRSETNLAATPVFARHTSLLDRLEMHPDFALRLGETVTNRWRLGSQALRNLVAAPRPVVATDLVPDIAQKGVDLRVGLDIARLALTQAVQVIVVVTGDSDLIPAFKFARREGVRVYLDHLGHGIRRDLKAHADRVISTAIAAPPPPRRTRTTTAPPGTT